LRYPYGRALQILTLTAARRGEVIGMRWDELDLAAGLWTLAGDRVKGKRPIVFPLSKATLKLLVSCPRFEGSHYVLASPRNGPITRWSSARTASIRASGVSGWRVHDLRRTARTNFSRLGVPADIGERVLGHVIPGIRGIYDRYDYLDEKRDALERWAKHVAKVVAAAPR